MGSTNNALNEENRNCIKKKLEWGGKKNFINMTHMEMSYINTKRYCRLWN